METLRFFLRGDGADPYVRQQGLAERREEATRTALDGLDPVRTGVPAAARLGPAQRAAARGRARRHGARVAGAAPHVA